MPKNIVTTPDFLLSNKFAHELYYGYAENQPIIDYHNHLSPRHIAEDHQFSNLTKLWLDGDHYKWRAMRCLGMSEELITGGASDEEKFKAWASVVPSTLRNPLFHWTHLELFRYFGITEYLSSDTADSIYNSVNQKLSDSTYSTRSLLKRMNVEALCTTEDPIDKLDYHKVLRESNFSVRVSTAFRPDKALDPRSEQFSDYLSRLGAAADIDIRSLDNLLESLDRRIQYFHQQGCRICDHGLTAMPFSHADKRTVEAIFTKVLEAKPITQKESNQYTTYVLVSLCERYHDLGWVQQFHLGPLRNNNTRKLATLGPDTGWDSIGDFQQASSLSAFLNELDQKDKLTKTIIYNLNPADNAVFASMIGNFQDGQTKGKIQYGSAWWFLDQKHGMIDQLNALSNMSLLSCFIGMLTDSRSFLSFPRHEYFRRILCDLLGREMENGELPQDLPWIGSMVADICYNNAAEYFDFSPVETPQSFNNLQSS